jgi:predicted transcriptional regulator
MSKKIWVIKSNINRRQIKDKTLLEYYYLIKKYSTRKIAKIFKVHNSTVSRTLHNMHIKIKYKKNLNKKRVQYLYKKRQLSMETIARLYNCSRSVIYRILTKLCIKIRPKKFYSKKERNGRWHGGLSFIEYPEKWSIELRKIIRKRDNYTCQICHKKGKFVHHIDYNKHNCNKNNLVTLCRKCHIATNSNRDYWYAYFTYLKGV